MSLIEIDRSEIPTLGPTLQRRLIDGQIIKVANVGEVTSLRDMMAASLSREAGASASEEFLNWTSHGIEPSATSAYHLARILRAMKRRFVFPTMFADFVRDLKFPEPVTVECGAPRFNLPQAVSDEFRDIVAREDASLGEPTDDDPTFHHILTETAYPHRDVGRPQISFQANLWCAFQDLQGEENSLMFFPAAFRDFERDRSKYAFDGSKNPEDWGYGPPLRVSLKFGDALLFSGDQFHSTPVPKGDSLRLSLEMRVVGHSFDDRGWYRLGFLNLNNFLPKEKDEPTKSSADRTIEVWEACGNEVEDNPPSTAIKCLVELCFDKSPTIQKVKKYTEWMKSYPFAEDRFLWSYFWLQANNPDTESFVSLQDFVIDNSQNFYWLLLYGGFALEEDRQIKAETAFEKSRLMGSHVTADTSSNAVNYVAALSEGESNLLPMLYEITPEDIDEVIRLFRSGQIRRGCSASTVELVREYPFVKGMMKLYFPYLQYHPIGRRTGFETKLAIVILWARLIIQKISNPNKNKFEPRRLEVGKNWLKF